MLPTLAIAFPAIDPVLVSIGPFSVHWYALSYVGGILLGWWYLHYVSKLEPAALSQKALDDIMVWVIFGIILGGRLGYVLFYNLPYYLEHPGDIFKVWQGGMAFHGGLVGVITAIYLLCVRHKLAFWPVIDRVACVTPIGLGLGRIANFINAELYGRATDVPWGVIFPGTTGPRHPSQLYESALEGWLLLLILYLLLRFTRARYYPGILSGCFLIGYGLARFTVEFFREPDVQLGYLAGGLTMGQLLCIPMIAFGLGLIAWAKKRSVRN